MTNYLENEVLLAQTWLDMATELKKKEEVQIDGDHFYNRNVHTFRVKMKNSQSVEIKFSDESVTDAGDSMIISADTQGLENIQKFTGVIKSRTIKYPSGQFYIHFPTQGSDIYTWGQNSSNQCGRADTSATTPGMVDDFHAT